MFFLCVCGCVYTLMDLWGHAGLCVFAPVWMNVYLCVGLYGKSKPAVVSGCIDKRLCATHVKFMFCTAFTKEAPEWFLGENYAGAMGG